MITLTQTVRVPANRKVTITIPSEIPTENDVQIVVQFKVPSESFQEKIAQLSTCMQDPLFLEDLKAVQDDFSEIDKIDWEEWLLGVGKCLLPILTQLSVQNKEKHVP